MITVLSIIHFRNFDLFLRVVINALTNPHQDLPTIPTVLPSIAWIQDILKDFIMDFTTHTSSSSPALLHFIGSLRDQVDELYREIKKCVIYSIASALG